uniref:F-box domain-containing protein n=1 Tax=Angiostrongylus cantonensis TaxID=6313 RepID=A0A158PCH2_ANGCA
MAGEVFRHKIDVGRNLDLRHTLHRSFGLCPHTRRVWIQTRLRQEHIGELKKHSNTIEELHISSENFDKRYPVSWNGFLPKRLRSLNILQRMDQPLNTRQMLDSVSCQALFPITLRHVVLTGIVLSRPLMDTILTLTNLRHFDAIGCVIDTNLGADYVEKLAQLSNLDEMSMPPSMFSFSVREENKIKFSMRKLRLSRLSLFMEQFDEDTFFEQLETIMPKKLKTLTIYGNYFPLKSCFDKMLFVEQMTVPESNPFRDDQLKIEPNAPTVAEEHNVEVNVATPNGTASASVATAVPVAPSQTTAPPSDTPLALISRTTLTAPPGIVASTQPVALSVQPQLDGRPPGDANVSATTQEAVEDPVLNPEANLPVPAPMQNRGPDESNDQNTQSSGVLEAKAFFCAIVVGEAFLAQEVVKVLDEVMVDRREICLHIEEISPDTVTPFNQQQAPDEVPLVAAQPTSPQGAQIASTPNTGTNANPTDRREVVPENSGRQPEHGTGHGGRHEHPAEENINMM